MICIASFVSHYFSHRRDYAIPCAPIPESGPRGGVCGRVRLLAARRLC